MKKKNSVGTVFIYVFLSVLALFMLFPIIYTVASSFKTNSEILAHPERIFPQNPTFDNYITAWNAKNFSIKNMFTNSIIYTAVSVTITLFSSAMCGYVFERGEFPGRKTIFAIFCSLMFISMGSITMYPYFEVLNFLNIEKSLYALLFIKVFGIPIVNIYLVRGFLSGIPRELDEAAKIDGCGFVMIFLRILLPLLQPILATIAILSFQGSWNDYLMPMIFTMSKPMQRTLIVGVIALKTTDQAASAWNLMLAGSTVALLPVLVVYCIGSKYFVQGIAAGAVKG